MPLLLLLVLVLPAGTVLSAAAPRVSDESWPRHTIDDSSQGADGVKLGDLNHDGRVDLVAGWEEGGVTRVYLHPGVKSVTQKWPAATIGRTPSSEDAVFVDLDGDNQLDVITSCEGNESTLYLHFAPPPGHELDAQRWTQMPLPGSTGKTRWMFATPLKTSQGHLIIAGSKNPNGAIGYWTVPQNPRSPLADWQWRPLADAGWIMSIIPIDMDDDGDADIFFIDRKEETRGARWLENPGDDGPWANHLVGGDQDELLFSKVVDLDQDGRLDILASAKDRQIIWWRGLDQSGLSWEERRLEYPENTGRAKAVGVGDLDQDGLLDFVVTCESAEPPAQGAFWVKQSADLPFEEWSSYGMAGPDGIKFDRIELLDIDYDGDLDVLTCEERHEKRGLGIFWYENRLGP